MASVLHGCCLYGAECHYIMKRQTQRARRIMCTAMGGCPGTPTGLGQIAGRKRGQMGAGVSAHQEDG